MIPTLDPSKFDKSNYMKEKPKTMKVEGQRDGAGERSRARQHTVRGRAGLPRARAAGKCSCGCPWAAAVRCTKAEVDPRRAPTPRTIASLSTCARQRQRRAVHGSGPASSPGTIQYTFVAQ